MLYALRTLLFEWRRYRAGVLAVSFSALLIAVQIGIMNGLMSMVSFPVDVSSAEVWVSSPGAASVDLGTSLRKEIGNRLLATPGVAAVDDYIQGFTYWRNPKGGNVLCIIAGCSLAPGALGPAAVLSDRERVLLSETGAVIINAPDRKRLGIDGIGDHAEIFGNRLRVVGFTRNMGSLTGPYVLCSLPTARKLLRMRQDDTTYLLAKCRSPDRRDAVLAALRSTRFDVHTAEDFSRRSRLYWITNTKAGLAIGFVALLGLFIGSVITSSTLYGATAASLRELMVLRALGVPRFQMTRYVLFQAFYVGCAGLLLAYPLMLGFCEGAALFGIRPVVPPLVLLGTAAVTLAMAVGSGFYALAPLNRIEPATLLR